MYQEAFYDHFRVPVIYICRIMPFKRLSDIIPAPFYRWARGKSVCEQPIALFLVPESGRAVHQSLTNLTLMMRITTYTKSSALLVRRKHWAVISAKISVISTLSARAVVRASSKKVNDAKRITTMVGGRKCANQYRYVDIASGTDSETNIIGRITFRE